MHCWIYKSLRREEMYLYLPGELDESELPEGLLAALQPLEPVMDLDLHAGRRLAREDVAQVLADLQGKGYFLQMPPGDAVHPDAVSDALPARPKD